jgi:hypothetical protein
MQMICLKLFQLRIAVHPSIKTRLIPLNFRWSEKQINNLHFGVRAPAKEDIPLHYRRWINVTECMRGQRTKIRRIPTNPTQLIERPQLTLIALESHFPKTRSQTMMW